ncbi:hypothetical protein [Thioalkalivibrio sp. ALR17-21]|uniref:hypothetical protein n=1 Tax=Thioalkalivibrio sp. ALR17-21 TaxID=1269813 RepID=UPI0004626A32|nr:hypothetical protein [Thioalkalivibrio sp. ALR17-21]
MISVALVLAAILWPAQLALNNPWQWAILVGPAIFVAVAAVLVMAGSTRLRMPQSLVLFTLVWLALAAVSAFWVGHPRVLQVYGALLLVFYLVAALAAASSDRLRLVRLLIIGVVVGGLALMAVSLLVEPFSLRRYQGLFNNPNSMGWFTAGLLHLVLGALYGNRLGFSRQGRRVLIIVLLLAAIFLLASNSRAALGSVMATGGVLGLLLWSESVHLRRGLVGRRGLRKLLLALVMMLAAVLLAWNAGLLIEIVEKFTETQHRGDLTQGRLDAWLASLRHWTWFGHGPDYAAAIGRVDMTTGHSTWISHLSRYGLVNALFFMAFLGYAAWWAWRAARRGSHPAAVVLLAVVIGFSTNATFETGTSTPGMWLTVILFAICLQGLGGKDQWVSSDRRGAG